VEEEVVQASLVPKGVEQVVEQGDIELVMVLLEVVDLQSLKKH
jgi:hypothetical protein